MSHTHSLCSALCPRLDTKVEQNAGSPSARVANADSVGGGSDTHHSSSTRDHDTHVRSLHDANRFLLCLTHKLCFVCFICLVDFALFNHASSSFTCVHRVQQITITKSGWPTVCLDRYVEANHLHDQSMRHMFIGDSDDEACLHSTEHDDEHSAERVLTALLARMELSSYSTAFSGVDSPGTAFAQLRASCCDKLAPVLNYLPHEPEHVHAIDSCSSSVDLFRSPMCLRFYIVYQCFYQSVFI